MNDKQVEPLAEDPQIVAELLSELDYMATQWATYPDRHPDTDIQFRAALWSCADQLRSVLKRCRSYCEWDEDKPATSVRLNDA